jgi:phage I-like protein
MKIQLGVRGNSDAVSAIIIKMDDLTLATSDNIFLIGEENRTKMGENLIKLLDTLSVDIMNDIEIGEKVMPMIERELNMENGVLKKYVP